MRRTIMLLAAAALLALMLVASAAPAMANNLFDDNGNFVGGSFTNNNLFDDNGNFVGGGFTNNDLFRHHHGLFANDDEGLDTIRVGDLRCLVEDRDDVKFCVNKDTGEIVRV
jgi:opacity protein-like surface antigen